MTSIVYADPGGASVFVAAAHWVQGVFLGPISTSVAVLAIASVGLLMLSGRISLRRAGTVIFGCFVLFGAATVAQGLRGAGSTVAAAAAPPQVTSPPLPPQLPSPAPETAALPPADPYAGASLRR